MLSVIGEHCDAPDTPQGTIRSPHCFRFAEIRRSRLDGQTSALRSADPTRKQHRGVEPDRCAVSTSPRTSKGQLLYRAQESAGFPQATFIFSFYRRAAWSVGRPGAAFSTPMSVALRRRFPRRRPRCPCCNFTSSTAISRKLAIIAWWISLCVPPRHPPRYCQTLMHRYQTVFEHRLSAGTRVTSHRGILHDFHQQATTSCTTHELSLF